MLTENEGKVGLQYFQQTIKNDKKRLISTENNLKIFLRIRQKKNPLPENLNPGKFNY